MTAHKSIICRIIIVRKEIKMRSFKRVISLLAVFAMVFTMQAAIVPQKAEAAAKKPVYKLEVSKSKCVVVAYKKENKKWKYVRTMLCSPGTSGRTPGGTFHLGGKQRWGVLMGPVYGQYCCNITSDVLFHSVWYSSVSKRAQNSSEFNRLGSPASHGCVRLATIDAKWIYDNCKKGTLIKIGYGKRTPKGKPKKIYSSSGWDPTDPDPRNPNFKLRKAVIKAKPKTLSLGKKYDAKKYVKATNPNALEDITNKVKVKALINGRWKKIRKIPTNIAGDVKIKFSVKYNYCKSASKTVTYTIADKKAPNIIAEDRTVNIGAKNAAAGAKARQNDGTNVTKTMKVTITDPAGKVAAKNITYSKAKKFVFKSAGEYKVTFTAFNKKYPDKKRSKTIIITVIDNSQQPADTDAQQTEQTDQQAEQAQ